MLKFLGTGSAFNTKLGNTSAYMKENGVLLLIDCGELVFYRILKTNLLEDVNEVHIAVTHTHSDHIGSLGGFIFYCFYIKGIKPIFHAANSDFIELLKIMGITEDHCIFSNCTFNITDVIKNLNLSLSFIKNVHVKELMTFGILLVKNHNKLHRDVIYYSGDSCEIDEKILDCFKSGDIHYLYQDTCKADYDGNVHLSLRKLTELIPDEYRDRVYCMHLDSGFIPEEAEQLGFNVVKVDKN